MLEVQDDDLLAAESKSNGGWYEATNTGCYVNVSAKTIFQRETCRYQPT